MFKKNLGCLVVVVLMLATPNMALAWCSGGCDCCRCPSGQAQCLGSYSSCEAACGLTSTPSYTPPSRDYEAERRAQEAAEATQRAEAERQAELERQRREAENKRLIEEAERQAKFIRDRDEAAGSLRGSTGVKITPNTSGGTALRGSTALKVESGLKDALNDTGLRGTQPAKNAAKSEQARAWQQLNCVAAITGYALKALENGNSQEFVTLINEASTKFDGGRPGVECPSAPAMPSFKSGMGDMEQVQGKQKQILDRAGKIAERMKQTEGKKPEAKASEAAPANETEIEKVRRVQKELNETNTRPIHNQQEEKDRKELTKLILENEKLISVDFNDSEEAPTPRRKHTEVPSPTR